MPGANTVLNYTIVPNPVYTGGALQDLTIIATLKSTAEFGQTLSSATIETIEINFGPATGDGNSLTNKTNVITAADFSPNDNWKVTDVSTNVVEVKPAPGGSGQIINDAIVLTVQSVQVNDVVGSVVITFTEKVSKINGSTSLIPPQVATNQTSVNLVKIEEKASGKSTFTSNYYAIKSGRDVTLSWNIADNKAPVSLHYISNNKFVHTGKPTAGNPYPGITKHTDGTLLKDTDHYPNSTYADPSTSLTLQDTTVFILKVGSGTTVTYLSLTVIVEDQEIYASSATIGTPESEISLMVYGQQYMKDPNNNFTIYTANDFYLWRIPPANADNNGFVEQLHIHKDGDMHVGGGITSNGPLTANGITSNGSLTANGITSDSSLTVTGDLTVKGTTNKVVGDLDVSGSLKTNFISTIGTARQVTGFNHSPMATWAPQKATASSKYGSTGGVTIDNIEGFSVTNGSGNIGYYWMDLGQPSSGMVLIDMYIANYNSSGTGRFEVFSSAKQVDAVKGFHTESSYQLWYCEQAPSDAFVQDNKVVRKLVRTYFEGQHIYIVARDLNNGQVGIKINKVQAYNAVGCIEPPG